MKSFPIIFVFSPRICYDIGSTIILKRKFSASQFWVDCRKHNVTVIQYIGEVLRYLCNTPKVGLTLTVLWESLEI